MTSNKALVERHILEVFSGGNFDIAEEIYAEDLIIHDPLNPEPLDRAGFVAMLQGYRETFPDLAYAEYTMIAQDDLVAVQYAITGTPAEAEAPVTLFGADVWRIEDNMIVEGWFIYDTLSFLQQLGEIPSEEPVAVGEPWAIPVGTTSTTPEENRDIIFNAADGVRDQGFYDVIDIAFTEDWVGHDLSRPEIATNSGLDGANEWIGGFYAAMPDMFHPMETSHIVAEGDMVAIHMSLEGTFTGEFMGIPGNGNYIEVWMINWWRIEDSKIAESWINLDTLSVISQLTAEPTED